MSWPSSFAASSRKVRKRSLAPSQLFHSIDILRLRIAVLGFLNMVVESELEYRAQRRRFSPVWEQNRSTKSILFRLDCSVSCSNDIATSVTKYGLDSALPGTGAHALTG
jgi:hypothetical protein